MNDRDARGDDDAGVGRWKEIASTVVSNTVGVAIGFVAVMMFWPILLGGEWLVLEGWALVAPDGHWTFYIAMLVGFVPVLLYAGLLSSAYEAVKKDE